MSENGQEDETQGVEPEVAISSGTDSDSMSDSDSDIDEDSDDSDEDEAADKPEEEDSDDEDETIKAIRKANVGEAANHPPCIEVKAGGSSISFHPEKELISIGTMKGSIEVYQYSLEKNELLRTIKHPDTLCREAAFSYDGSQLVGTFGNHDLAFYDVETGKPILTVGNATDGLVMSVLSVDEHITFTGDDDGHVNLWDNRQKFKSQSMKVGEDAISSMVCDEAKKVLVCSCLDGFIASIKIRGGKVDVKSEIFEKTEFTCMGLFKQNSKLAVGAADGNMYVFNWDEFGYPNDILSTGKHGINDMVPITDRIAIIGGDEGSIRAKHLFPYKNIGIVGDHTVSVDRMDVCNDGHLVASLSSVDSCIDFLNVSYFQGYTLPVEPKATNPKASNDHKLPSSKQKNPGDFFKGLLD